jgi:hypothetical protein
MKAPWEKLWAGPELALSAALALFGPESAFAQFQPPTDEELKMTAEPKAPGAAAIYLYREEAVDDNLHFHSLYVRIKVLTEKGKELATVGVPYWKGNTQITDIHARTIHTDGTVIPLDVKPSDLVEEKGKGFQVNKVVFTLPSVEVGSILEYKWQERYPDDKLNSPDWEIQGPYYVRKAHYSFWPYQFLYRVTDSKGNAANNLLYTAILPKGGKVLQEASGRYTVDVADIKPLPHEEYSPPVTSWMESVHFYYTPYLSKDEYWKHQGESWSKEMDRFAGETKTLRDAVAGIVAPGDSDEVKARKIYDAVQALDNTNYTRRKSQGELKEQHLKQAKSAEDVWNQKSGDGDQIALLYMAMARIAGLNSYALLVCDRNRAIFNSYYLSMRQFSDVLVTVSLNGKEIPLDPGKKFASFGELDWRHSMTSGLHQTDKGTVLASTPAIPVKQAATLRVADLTVSKDGSVTGTVRISMNGPAAVYWRELAVENDEDEVKKRFNESLRSQVPDGVTAEFDHFLGLEDYHSQLMAMVKISGNMGTATGKRMFVPGLFFASRAKHPFVEQEKRETAVDMEYGDVVQDDVTYLLPEGLGIESAPADATIPWTGHAAFQVKAVSAANQITVKRTFVRAFTILEPKEYPDLRDYYQKIATVDQQQLVLTAASKAAAGVAAAGKAGGQ